MLKQNRKSVPKQNVKVTGIKEWEKYRQTATDSKITFKVITALVYGSINNFHDIIDLSPLLYTVLEFLLNMLDEKNLSVA
jgi:hypothetical protein